MRGPSGETRRSERVATTFLVAIEGVDATLVPRRGDISANGIYFESDHPIGPAGTVQLLHIASTNRAREIRMMAHVVRALTLEELGGRKIYGVAFELLPESAEAIAALEALVEYVLLVVDEPTNDEPRLAPRLAALALGEPRSSERSLLKQLSVRSMKLEASWNIEAGEPIRIELTARGLSRRVRLEGSAVRVRPIGRSGQGPPFEIEVEFESEVERPSRTSSMDMAAIRPEQIEAALDRHEEPLPFFPDSTPELARSDDSVADALDDLFSPLIHPGESGRASDPRLGRTSAAKPKREHLSGLLARIRLPTLCALFDMERLSGELTLRRGDARAVIYVRDGRLVDVDPLEPDVTPRAGIGRLLAWDEGSFEFAVRDVDRPDRIGVSTTALLLDLAREADEAARPTRER
jgi:hypothetical protein